MTDTNTPFHEARLKMDDLQRGVIELESLTECGNLKYLTRSQREIIFTSLLEAVSALEDTIKAMVREGRNVKRARLRDDDVLSRMVRSLTEHGLCVSQFETESQVVGEYRDNDEATPPSTNRDDDVADALKVVKGEE